jgi:CrcB protein
VSLPGAVLVGVGGVFGAVARFLVGTAVERRRADTLVVNALGSFALGAVLAAPLGGGLAVGVGVGFCGAFTTFSSFAVETVELAEAGRPRRALGYAAGTLVVALAAAGAGSALAGAFV